MRRAVGTGSAVKDLERARILRAREALEGAHVLLEEGMDAAFVLTSAFDACYHAVLAVMNEGRPAESLQSATIELFDRQFIRNGIFPADCSGVLHRLFNSKPRCGGGRTTAAAGVDLRELLESARRFIAAAEGHLRERR